MQDKSIYVKYGTNKSNLIFQMLETYELIPKHSNPTDIAKKMMPMGIVTQWDIWGFENILFLI